MRESDYNRVEFHSKEDLLGPRQLQKGEFILRRPLNSGYNNINDILELYNIKKYIDNDLYLVNWSLQDIADFQKKTKEYGQFIGQFFSKVNNDNFLEIYDEILLNYIDSFWELVNNQNTYKRISKTNFENILSREPHLIYKFLIHKNIVLHYNTLLKKFLLNYSGTAEILLSIYEVKDDYDNTKRFLPKSLTVEDKEIIISDYLNSDQANLNYIEIIQNIRNTGDFKISDKIRLKAKRLHKIQTADLFKKNSGTKYGVSISFPINAPQIKKATYTENNTIDYSYSFDFIKENSDNYFLFKNFKYLFEYLDDHNRIDLVNKESQMDVLERVMGVNSKNDYNIGTKFFFSEMKSQGEVYSYSKVLKELNNTLENILNFVFTSAFQEKYDFPDNAIFSIPTATTYLEKVRFLAPEFESALKQFKLFVEDGIIDFELLQISSSPSSIKDIPSLNDRKYIYLNKLNLEISGCLNLLFSDQSLLSYIEPFKEKKYRTFFDLLANEDVKFSYYENYQKPRLQYLIENEFIFIDKNDYIQFMNFERVLILKDLNDNEVGSYYHYPHFFRNEANKMMAENVIYFESSLFSKPEQAYFNYYLNKKDFTNGLDLRNSYLHGTQAYPNEIEKHKYAYFKYLKLIFLAFLKIDDDLKIFRSTVEKRS